MFGERAEATAVEAQADPVASVCLLYVLPHKKEKLATAW
jgi:hypothetical protein